MSRAESGIMPTRKAGDGSTAAGGSKTRSRLLPSLDSYIKSVGGIVAIIVIWDLIVRIFKIPRFLLPSPWSVFQELYAKSGYFMGHTWVTLYESILGFSLGAVLGVLCGLALSYVPLLRASLYPSLIAINTIPKVALAPLFIVWFGFGTTSKIVVALLIAFFPVVVSTVDGLSSVPLELKHLARLHHASPWMRFRRIDFMHALPTIFTGLKVSISTAVGGAVVGEFIGGRHGLGHVIIVANNMVNLPAMFSSFILLALTAVGLFLVVELLQRVLLPWANRNNQH